MSILACLIGILTLMISLSMQVRQLQSEDHSEEEMQRAIANRDLKYKTDAASREIRKLEQQLEKEKSTTLELAKLEQHRIVLRNKLDEIEKARSPEKTDAALQKAVEDMKLEIAALKNSRPPLAKRIEELRRELQARATPPKPVESVIIRPGGVGARHARNLFFVECTSTGIIIHREKKPAITIPTAAIETHKEFKDLLTEVKRTHDSMVLFLIRRQGNPAYLWAAGVAETQFQVKTGKLPVPNDGPIDLSLFHR